MQLKLLPYKIISLIKRLPNMRCLTNIYFFLLTVFIISVHADFGWNLPPEDLTQSNNNASQPQICCDNSGNAFAVWTITLEGEVNSTIQAAYFNGITLTWSNFTILSDDSENANDPQICCDDSGNAFAIWDQSNGSNTIIHTSHFDGISWIPMGDLSASGQSAFEARICCNNSGEAFAIWRRSDGLNTIIQASNFDGSSWTSISDVVNLSPNGQTSSAAEVCCNDLGHAVAVWQTSNASPFFIQASNFDGSSWTPPDSAPILSDTAQNARTPAVCCDNSGNAIAVWQRFNGSNNIIQASQFDGSSWAFEGDLSAPGGSAGSAQVCCDNSGNAFAIWQRSNGSNNITQASQFDGSSWTPISEVFELSAPGQSAFSQQICCDDFGNAFAIWQRSNGSNNIIQTSQFDGISWSSPAENLSSAGISSTSPQICCNNSQRAISIWNLSSSPNPVIQSALYLPPILSPTNFQGNRVTNRFPSQSAVSAHLSWTPNTDPNVTSFSIYRNENLIATIPSYLSSYKDCNIDPCQSYSYTIISVNTTGDESTGETISI